MDIYDMIQHLIPKLRNKPSLKINNLGHMMQNWTSIVESNWIFSKLYLLIYVYIYIDTHTHTHMYMTY